MHAVVPQNQDSDRLHDRHQRAADQFERQKAYLRSSPLPHQQQQHLQEVPFINQRHTAGDRSFEEHQETYGKQTADDRSFEDRQELYGKQSANDRFFEDRQELYCKQPPSVDEKYRFGDNLQSAVNTYRSQSSPQQHPHRQQQQQQQQLRQNCPSSPSYRNSEKGEVHVNSDYIFYNRDSSQRNSDRQSGHVLHLDTLSKVPDSSTESSRQDSPDTAEASSETRGLRFYQHNNVLGPRFSGTTAFNELQRESVTRTLSNSSHPLADRQHLLKQFIPTPKFPYSSAPSSTSASAVNAHVAMVTSTSKNEEKEFRKNSERHKMPRYTPSPEDVDSRNKSEEDEDYTDHTSPSYTHHRKECDEDDSLYAQQEKPVHPTGPEHYGFRYPSHYSPQQNHEPQGSPDKLDRRQIFMDRSEDRADYHGEDLQKEKVREIKKRKFYEYLLKQDGDMAVGGKSLEYPLQGFSTSNAAPLFKSSPPPSSTVTTGAISDSTSTPPRPNKQEEMMSSRDFFHSSSIAGDRRRDLSSMDGSHSQEDPEAEEVQPSPLQLQHYRRAMMEQRSAPRGGETNTSPVESMLHNLRHSEETFNNKREMMRVPDSSGYPVFKDKGTGFSPPPLLPASHPPSESPATFPPSSSRPSTISPTKDPCPPSSREGCQSPDSPEKDRLVKNIKKEVSSPYGSPVKGGVDSGSSVGFGSTSSSSSSMLTKIPLGLPAFHPGFQGDQPAYPELMMGGMLGGPTPLHAMPPGMPPAGGSREDGRNKDMYFCHLCNYSGNSKEEFDSHMTIHFEFKCQFCDYTSRTEGRLKRHIKDFHSSDNQSRTVPGRPKVFRCKQCEFSSFDKIEFWKHARVHIKEDKMLECMKCPFVTEYKHHLEYHLRNHMGCKPYKCNKCNYSCVNKSMLNSHMKSHTNVYQYRCADCTYATKYCHSLKLHLRKYSHKPATVLNSDGSLPQGIDAEISGLSLLAKRGPPRGPRGMRRDGDQSGEGMPPRFFPPGFNSFMNGGMVNGAMMPNPYWSMMQGSMHPPPPLIPVGGPMRKPGQTDMDTSESLQASASQSELWLSCMACPFQAESYSELQEHVFKVHTMEKRDKVSALPGNLSDVLKEEEEARTPTRRMSAPAPSASQGLPEEPSPESYPRRNTIGTGTLSFRARNAVEPYPSRSLWGRRGENKDVLDGRYRDDAYTEQEEFEMELRRRKNLGIGEEKEPLGGSNILRQMTLKFGAGDSMMDDSSVPMSAMNMAANIAARAMQEPEAGGALDLSNKTAHSPPLRGESNPSSSPPQTLISHHYDQQLPPPPLLPSSSSPPMTESESSSAPQRVQENVASSGGEDIAPRKRSRKGKAFRLDTVRRRREHQLQQEEQEQQDIGSPVYSDSMESPSPDTGLTTGNPHEPQDMTAAPSSVAAKTGAEKQEASPMDGNHYQSAAGLEETDDPLNQLNRKLELVNQEHHPEQYNQRQASQYSLDEVVPSSNDQESVETPSAHHLHSSDTEQQPLHSEDVTPPSQKVLESTDMSEENVAETRISMMQFLNESRHKTLPQSMRRGAEVAFKILNELNAETEGAPAPPTDEKTGGSSQRIPATSPPSSPPPSSSSPKSSTHGSGYLTSQAHLPSPLTRSALPSTVSISTTPSASVGLPKRFPHSSVAPRAFLPSPARDPMLEATARAMKESASLMSPFADRHSAYAQTFHHSMYPGPSSTYSNSRLYHPSHPPPIPIPAPAARSLHPYECPHCDMGFKDQTMFTLHMSLHPEGDNPYLCKVCGHECRDKVEFTAHMMQHPHSDERD